MLSPSILRGKEDISRNWGFKVSLPTRLGDKTIQNCNNSEVNRKISIHNHVLFNLINRFVHPHTLIHLTST